MSDLYRRVERMWWSHEKPPLILRMVSGLYSGANRINLALRAQRAEGVSVPVISVGNLTAGGSGKTPFVIWLATELKERGYKPVVLCRGDGGKVQNPTLIDNRCLASDVGDEALLLHQMCRCPVIAARDRIEGAVIAARQGDIIILDDGFQYRHLYRNCDIVLIPAEGLGNGHQIPAGPLREDAFALDRADLIVRTGESGECLPLTKAREWRWLTGDSRLRQLAGPPSEIPDRVIAMTAIARPERFVGSLQRQGLTIDRSHLFPDHHLFDRDEVTAIASEGLPVAVTTKDAVKLKGIWPDSCPLWVLEQSFNAEQGLMDAILTIAEKERSDGDA